MFGFGRSAKSARSGAVGGLQFDAPVRISLQLARDNAVRLRTPQVTPDHILLGILDAGGTDAGHLLAALGIRTSVVRAALESLLAPGAGARARAGSSQDLPYTREAKRVLENAMREATTLDHSAVTSAHLLLGVLAESGAAASKLLGQHGATLDAARSLVRSGLPERPALTIRIDDRSDRLIYQQIVAQIEEAIAIGRLIPGERLPPIRQLADELEIAPGTVARAYGDLESAGVVITDRARGTFVAPNRAHSEGERRAMAVRDLFRPAAVAAFHLGASAAEIRAALDVALADIYPSR
jgi:GntR family transcriptional regulator